MEDQRVTICERREKAAEEIAVHRVSHVIIACFFVQASQKSLFRVVIVAAGIQVACWSFAVSEREEKKSKFKWTIIRENIYSNVLSSRKNVKELSLKPSTCNPFLPREWNSATLRKVLSKPKVQNASHNDW